MSYTSDPKKCDLSTVFESGASNIDWKVNTGGLEYIKFMLSVPCSYPFKEDEL